MGTAHQHSNSGSNPSAPDKETPGSRAQAYSALHDRAVQFFLTAEPFNEIAYDNLAALLLLRGFATPSGLHDAANPILTEKAPVVFAQNLKGVVDAEFLIESTGKIPDALEFLVRVGLVAKTPQGAYLKRATDFEPTDPRHAIVQDILALHQQFVVSKTPEVSPTLTVGLEEPSPKVLGRVTRKLAASLETVSTRLGTLLEDPADMAQELRRLIWWYGERGNLATAPDALAKSWRNIFEREVEEHEHAFRNQLAAEVLKESRMDEKALTAKVGSKVAITGKLPKRVGLASERLGELSEDGETERRSAFHQYWSQKNLDPRERRILQPLVELKSTVPRLLQAVSYAQESGAYRMLDYAAATEPLQRLADRFAQIEFTAKGFVFRQNSAAEAVNILTEEIELLRAAKAAVELVADVLPR